MLTIVQVLAGGVEHRASGGRCRACGGRNRGRTSGRIVVDDGDIIHRFVVARGVGMVVVRQRVVGMTHVVGVDRVGAMTFIVRRSPSPEVHIVVISHMEVDGTMWTSVGVVGRHTPDEVGGAAKIVEAQIAGGAVELALCGVKLEAEVWK